VLRCIGHGGASALAPANTLRSFELAVELGADMVEFDVRRHGGRLLLAHTVLDALRPCCLELDDALAWLSTEGGDGLGLVLDLKSSGIEHAVVDALRRHRLQERAIVTSQRRLPLRRIAETAPAVRTAVSIAGRLSRAVQRWGEWRDEVVADLRAGRHRAVMAHRRLVDGDLVDRVRDAGAELYAWTARRPADVAALARLQPDGIVTTDPRLLAAPQRAGR
jgi:glycerophosphoryl diester phosphodiesterase